MYVRTEFQLSCSLCKVDLPGYWTNEIYRNRLNLSLTRFPIFQMYVLVALLLLRGASGSSESAESVTSGVNTTPSASSSLGALYRQARSDQYYTNRYAGDGSSVNSGTIGTRSDTVEPRDAAYFESRCITCDPNKSSASNVADRG